MGTRSCDGVTSGIAGGQSNGSPRDQHLAMGCCLFFCQHGLLNTNGAYNASSRGHPTYGSVVGSCWRVIFPVIWCALIGWIEFLVDEQNAKHRNTQLSKLTKGRRNVKQVSNQKAKRTCFWSPKLWAPLKPCFQGCPAKLNLLVLGVRPAPPDIRRERMPDQNKIRQAPPASASP